jgi:hypothetical protein
MSLKPKNKTKNKQSTTPRQPVGRVKRLHYTGATDCFTLEYENGFRKVVPKNYRGLSRKQKLAAIKNRGMFIPLPKK